MEKPTIKRKEREREARREAILDAASRVFSRKNFYEATLKEIAQEAELAKGTLYNYYKDKDDIFFSLIERSYTEFLGLLPVLVQQKGTLQEFLQNIFSHSLAYMVEHKYLFRVVFTAEHHLSYERWENKMRKFLHHVSGMVDNLAHALSLLPETRDLSEAERRTGAGIILASMRYLFIMKVIGSDEGVPRSDVEDFTRLISRALTVEQPA